eukprot:TRINITY_DN13834_c0_g2_i1.p1 TRINITY_DN13834_c0_g2~~TRINITY_DN13834_c0_g2_i1.p1  ORF type:complete len:1546 (+),score=333.25 TRINITY_DN13834_c0_g2_i1:34-4671(+)
MDGDELWDSLRDNQVPKTLANHDQVKRVTYDGEPITMRGAVLVGVTEFDCPEISNLPTPLRDIQLLEERFRSLKVDHITVLTSARKDKGSKPKFANIVRAIQEMRERITNKGLLLVVISTHGFVSDRSLCLAATDYDPYTRSNLLRIDDLSALISPNRNDRGCLVADYGSHWKETQRCFKVDVGAPVPLPPLRLGFSLMCSPPKLSGSFSAKFAGMLDELIGRQLPICPNSVYAIFDKHSVKWFGQPKLQMILMSDRAQTAPSGKLPLFDWARASQLDTGKVSYTVTMSMALPTLNSAVPDTRVMCQTLKHACPHIKIRQIASEDQRRFIIKLTGGSPSRGPREDKIYYAREVAAMCEEQGIPFVDVIKAWFGKLICVTDAQNFEEVLKGLMNNRLLRSFNTPDPPPVIEYIGVLCRPEVTSSFSTHLTLDEICRRHVADKQTGIYIEELNQIDDTHDDAESEAHSHVQSHVSRPLTPSVSASAAWAAPPASPSDEGSPMLTKVISQPWQQPTSTPASLPVPVSVTPAPAPAPPPVPISAHVPAPIPAQDSCKADIARLEHALERERADREASMEVIAKQLQALQSKSNCSHLEVAVQQLQRGQDALVSKLETMEQVSPARSPGRGGAAIHVTNDEWMVYQDELKLLQVQLKDVQTSMPAGMREARPAGTGTERLQLEQLHKMYDELNFKIESGAGAGKAEVDKILQQSSHHFGQYDEALKTLQMQLNETTRNIQQCMATQAQPSQYIQKVAPTGLDSPSADDIRTLRQRVERIEGLGHHHAYAPSPMRDTGLDARVEALQSTVERLMQTTRGDGDIRKTYNDMMLEDIDAQLHGKDVKGVYTPGAPVYLPSGLRSAIHTMVSGMIATAKEQTEKWTAQVINQHRDQVTTLNSSTQEQIMSVQYKLGNMEADKSHNSIAPPMDSVHDPALETHAQQLTANMSAINGLEQSLHMVQNTLTSHANRLQSAEVNLDNHVTELQGSVSDIRGKVDSTIQKIGQSILELDQKMMKDVTDAGARVTVAEQRIAHIDGRLAEDGDKLHRMENRIEMSTRQLQDRIDEQNQKLFETERKVTTSLDDKVSVMRQIAEIAEKGTLDLEKKWQESEGQLKQQLRAALQQHIEGLEDVLQGMRSDVKGVENKAGLVEAVVDECRMATNMLDQKMQMTEKTLEALRGGFETYVHDGTVHIMQAQNEKLDELRGKLGQELDTFDHRIKGIEAQRRAADEELATALEKIQVAVANQPSHDKVNRALAEMEENRIRPAMEAASKSYELMREVQGIAQRIDGLTDQVVENSKETRTQAELQRDKNIELSMLKDQVAHLKEMQRNTGMATPIPPPAHGASNESVRDLEHRVTETERKISEYIRMVENTSSKDFSTDISSIREQINSIREQINSIRDQSRSMGSAGESKGEVRSAPDNSGRVADIETRLAETEKTVTQQDQLLQEMVNTIEAQHQDHLDLEGQKADITSLRSKVNSMSGGDADDLMQESLTKLKQDLSIVKKEVDKLKGWKTGKEAESALLERNSNLIRDLKKEITNIKDHLEM